MQKADLQNYCKYVLNINDFEIFEDAGYSAKNTDRPDYQKMMARLRTGEFSHIVVWKIDRISRNLQDFLEMYEELKRLGVSFVSRNEQFDTSTAMGEAMLKIILVFAELERNTTSERVSNVMVSRAESGKWNGGRVPYGYISPGKGQIPIVDENEAAVVKFIFNRYETTKSLLYTARDLNDKGIKTKRGNQWSATTIWIIVRNPWYIGSYVYNKRDESTGDCEMKDESCWVTIPNHHEAIISKEQFDRVQETLKGNTRDKTRWSIDRTTRNTHIFSSLLTCDYCKGNMTATIDRPRNDGTRPSIYACYSKRKSKDCDNKFISDIKLVPFILSYVRCIIKASQDPETTAKQLRKNIAQIKVMGAIESIDGIEDTIQLIKSGVSGVEYSSPVLRDVNSIPREMEKESLEYEYRKNLRALSRLKNAYLYSDEELDKAEYIKEKTALEETIKKQEVRLSEMEAEESNSKESAHEFEVKASYVLMLKLLQSDSHLDYSIVSKSLDPAVVKNFVSTIIESIGIADGKVTWIRFRNGITHTIKYTFVA